MRPSIFLGNLEGGKGVNILPSKLNIARIRPILLKTKERPTCRNLS